MSELIRHIIFELESEGIYFAKYNSNVYSEQRYEQCEESEVIKTIYKILEKEIQVSSI